MISVATVKGTLTSLFDLFELEALPQNQKRAALAKRGLDAAQLSGMRASVSLPSPVTHSARASAVIANGFDGTLSAGATDLTCLRVEDRDLCGRGRR